MALRFSKNYTSEVEMINDMAKSSQLYSQSDYDSWKADKQGMEYLYSVAGTVDLEKPASFDDSMYRGLSREGKLQYITNEYYVDRTLKDNRGLNIYDATSEFLKYDWQVNQDTEFYNNLNFVEKAIHTVLGVGAGAFNELWGTLQGLISAGSFLVQTGSEILTGEDSEASKNIKSFTQSDILGHNKMREELDNYYRRYTFLDKSFATKLAHDVFNGIVRMTPMLITGGAGKLGRVLGTTAYYGASAGNTIQDIYAKNPNQSTKSVFAYTALSTGLEIGVERLSDKVFNSGNIVDKLIFGDSVNVVKRGLIKDLGMSFLTEGLEEMVSEIIDPMLYGLIIDEKLDVASIEDILYAGLVGGLIGFTMGGGSILSTQSQSIVGTDQTIKLGDKEFNLRSGELISSKLAKGLGVSDSIKLGKYKTSALRQVLSQAMNVEQSEVGELMRENPNKTWDEIVELDPNRARLAELNDANSASREATVALSKLLTELGVDNFTKAVDRFAKFAEMENANAEFFIEANTINRNPVYQKIQKAHNDINKDSPITIIDPPTVEYRNLQYQIKKKYGVDVYIFRGNIGDSGASFSEGVILVNENAIKQYGLEGTLHEVIKEELLHNLQRTGDGKLLTEANLEYLDKLIKSEASSIMPEMMSLDIEAKKSYLLSKLKHLGTVNNRNIDVKINETRNKVKSENATNSQTVSDYNNLYALRNLYRPIGDNYVLGDEYDDVINPTARRAEQQAKTMLDFVLFDGLTVDKMYNTDPNLFGKIYAWMKNLSKNTYKIDESGKFKYELLQQQMSMYRKMLAANTDNTTIDSLKVKMDLTDNQIELMKKVEKKPLIEHYGFIAQDYTFDEFNKSELINKLVENSVDGEIDFFRFGDPEYYTESFRNFINEAGNFLTDKGEFDFKRNINKYLVETFGNFIHFPSNQLMRSFNFYNMMEVGVLEDAENLSAHEFVEKYPNTLDLFSESALSNFKSIDGVHPFQANIIVSYLDNNSNTNAWYNSSTGDIYLNGLNKVKLDSIIHELIHHQSEMQGLSSGSNPTAIRNALTGEYNSKHLDKLIKLALTQEFIDSAPDANQIFDALSYWIYIKTSGEINANVSSNTIESKRVMYGDFDVKLKGFAMTSGFDSDGSKLTGFGKLKGITIDLYEIGSDSGLSTDTTNETNRLLNDSLEFATLSSLWSKKKGFSNEVSKKRASESKVYNFISELYKSPLGKEFSIELENSITGITAPLSLDRLKQLINSNSLGSDNVTNAIIKELYPNNKHIITIQELRDAQASIPQLMFLERIRKSSIKIDFDPNKSYTLTEIFKMVEDVYTNNPDRLDSLSKVYDRETERYDKLRLDEKNSGEESTWFLNNDFDNSYQNVKKLLDALRGVGLVYEKGLADFYINTSEGEVSVVDVIPSEDTSFDDVLSEGESEKVASYEDRLFESINRTKDKAELENQYKMLSERKEATLELLRQDYRDSKLSKAEIESRVNDSYNAARQIIEDTGAIDLETYKGSSSERAPHRQKIWRLRKQISSEIDVSNLNTVESRLLNADHNDMSLKELTSYATNLEALRNDVLEKYKDTTPKVEKTPPVEVKKEATPVKEKVTPIKEEAPPIKKEVAPVEKENVAPVEKPKFKDTVEKSSGQQEYESHFTATQNKVLNTTYEKTTMTKVQKVNDGNQETYVIRTREHMDANKSFYNNLTDSEAQQLIKTWDNAPIGTFTPSEFELRRTNMTIFLMNIIENPSNFDATTVALAKSTLAEKLSWSGKDLALWSRVFERANRIEQGLKHFEEKFGKKLEGITEEDISAYNEAIKNKDFKKLMEMERLFIKKVTEQAPKNEYKLFDGTMLQRFNEFKRLLKSLHGFRYMAMLTNPATHVKNYVSNIGMKIVEKATDALTKLFESIIPAEKDQYRYFTNTKISKEVSDYVTSMESMFTYLLSGGKYEMSDGSLTFQVDVATKYNNKFLQTLSQKIYDSLEGNDIKFVLPAAMKNLETLMESNNITPAQMEANRALFGELIENAVWRASKQYLKAQNNFSKAWNDIASKNIFLDIFMGTILPFPKVAYNITQQLMEHSPVSLAKAAYKLVQAKTNPQVLADNPFFRADTANLLAKGTSGTLMMIVGLILSQLGVLKFDEDELFNGVVLNVGEFKVKLSDLAPSISPMLIGAALSSKAATNTNVVERFTNIIGEQTMLGAFDELFGYGRTVWDLPVNAVETYMLQYVPAILKTTAKAFDNNVKKYDQAWYRVFQKIAAGIPGVSYAVPNKINPYTGEPAKRYSTPIIAFLNIPSPIRISTVNKESIQWEAERLGVKTTGSNGNFKLNDTDIKLKGRALENFSAKRGEYIQKEATRFLKGSETYRVRVDHEDGSYTYDNLRYSEMDDVQRANVLSGIYTSATHYAKISYWVDKGNSYISTSLDEFDKLREYVLKNIRYVQGYNKSKFVK